MSMPRVAAFAWLAAGFLAAGSTATAQSFTFERSFPATAASRLEVATNRGKITVRAGTTAELVVTGRVSVRVGWNVPRGAVAMARTTADDPPIAQIDDIVRLGILRDARTRRAVTIAYEVHVPAGTAVVTQSESGETRVEGVRGAVSVRTQSGAVTLADLGQTRIETGSGAVSVDGAGPLRVATSSSRITATRLVSDLYVRTESGRVTAVFAGEGDADVETGSSAITVHRLNGGLVASTRSGRVRISSTPSRPWHVITGSSAIEAEFDACAAFSVEAVSGSGSVRTEDLAVRGETSKGRVAGSIAAGGPTVTLTSRSGSITLTSADTHRSPGRRR